MEYRRKEIVREREKKRSSKGEGEREGKVEKDRKRGTDGRIVIDRERDRQTEK